MKKMNAQVNNLEGAFADEWPSSFSRSPCPGLQNISENFLRIFLKIALPGFPWKGYFWKFPKNIFEQMHTFKDAKLKKAVILDVGGER